MLLENFVGTFVHTSHVDRAQSAASEDMRRHQYLITNDVMRYMAEYEVRRLSYVGFVSRGTAGARQLQANGDPDVIGRLVLLLEDWHFAWAPGGE
jgi:hypothetical protein